MNRAKILFTSVVTLFSISLISINSNAQGFYIDLGAGYGFNASSGNIGNNITNTVNNSATTSDSATVKGSYGKGVNYGATFGYMVNEHVGGEVGISYLSGSSYSFNNNNTDIFGNTTFDNRTVSATMLRIMPAIKLQGEPGMITPYLKAGLVFGLAGSIKENHTVNYSYPNAFPSVPDTTETTSATYSGGVSIGFMAAIGMDVKLGNKVSIYGEIGMISQTWAPTQWVLNADARGETGSTGTDQLQYMTPNQKQTNFTDSYSNTGITNVKAPSEAWKTYLPFSSWGINIGLHFTFGGEK